jgi:tetratricopeptide (TPR) repeat protein
MWQWSASLQLKPVTGFLLLLAASVLFVSWPNSQPSLWALDAYNSGWQALEAGNLQMAENKLALAYAYVPTNSEINFALGNSRLAENKTGEAVSFFDATLRLDPHHKGALNNLGVIHLEHGELAPARRYFEQALNETPGDAKTHYLLARTLYAQGDLAAARAAIDAALSLKPTQHEFTDFKAKLTAVEK